MASLNKIQLIGNLGRDPELRVTKSGQSVTNFSIATTEVWKDKDDQKQERTTWFNVTCWGGLAENVAQFLTKGRQAYVEGRLQDDEYENKDGVTVREKKVVAQNVLFLGSNNGSSPEREMPAKVAGKPVAANKIPF